MPDRRHAPPRPEAAPPREQSSALDVEFAALTGLIWLICDAAGLGTWWSVVISFAVGFTVRLLALYLGWEEPLAKEPKGVYQHSDGRPLLGRKIAGKSQRELHDLGLVVDSPASGVSS